jgi:hypothetical protein
VAPHHSGGTTTQPVSHGERVGLALRAYPCTLPELILEARPVLAGGFTDRARLLVAVHDGDVDATLRARRRQAPRPRARAPVRRDAAEATA